MLTLSIVIYFIAAIYFMRVIDSAWNVISDPEFFIIAIFIFLGWPIALLIGLIGNSIKFKHFKSAITSFFD